MDRLAVYPSRAAWLGALLLTASSRGSVLGATPAPLAGPQTPTPHAPPFAEKQLPLNLILIVLDDVGTDKLALYDETPPACAAGCPPCPDVPPPYAATPNLDALAARGMLFEDFYVNPVCSTSRALVHSGRYAFQNGIGGLTDGETGPCPGGELLGSCIKLADSEVLLPELLRLGRASPRAYRCGAFGKWHMTYDPGDETHAVVNGYHRFHGTMRNLFDHFSWPKVEHDAGGSPALFTETRWSGSAVREDAVEWIERQREPFFAYVAFHAPHTPWQVPPTELVSDEVACELAALEASSGNMGLFVPGAVALPSESEHKRQLFYRAMLEAVDTEIGNLLAGIAPAVLARTMVFVLSDNGTQAEVVSQPPHDNQHAKRSVYRLGTRVPMIVAGPLIPPPPAGGWRCGELVSGADVWRTFADIAGADEAAAFAALGVDPAPPMPGVSFRSLLEVPGTPSPRAWAFVQTFTPNVFPQPKPFDYLECLRVHTRAITDGEFKYVHRQIVKAVDPCAPREYEDDELYHVSDLLEADNLWDPVAGAVVPSAPPGAEEALDELRSQMFLLSGD